MIEGEVVGWEPIIGLTVLGPVGVITLDAVVDTGLMGALTLPAETIERLGLRFLSIERTSLADDRASLSRVFAADVLWDGDQRQVVAIEMGSTPLVGMGLLSGFRLTVDSVEGEGRVTIERLSSLSLTT